MRQSKKYWGTLDVPLRSNMPVTCRAAGALMATKITKTQQAVLDYVKSHIAEEGHPPTIREIKYHFGYASENSAFEHLEKLKLKGFITIERGKARGIKIVGDSSQPDEKKMMHALIAISTLAQRDMLSPQTVISICEEALA